ncbi:hypothetical protein [Candidatus Methanomassiliicoccus intestinalis]|uniref:hypothetical protein n=1 Tax=Candidatus Methanomassiliicoccus intestinalis TaxID=1406512 RepID=UPI0037DC7868
MFGPYLVGKALCACGALADLDEEVIIRKKLLGKAIECTACRNKRIAEELEKEAEDSAEVSENFYTSIEA